MLPRSCVWLWGKFLRTFRSTSPCQFVHWSKQCLFKNWRVWLNISNEHQRIRYSCRLSTNAPPCSTMSSCHMTAKNFCFRNSSDFELHFWTAKFSTKLLRCYDYRIRCFLFADNKKHHLSTTRIFQTSHSGELTHWELAAFWCRKHSFLSFDAFVCYLFYCDKIQSFSREWSWREEGVHVQGCEFDIKNINT